MGEIFSAVLEVLEISLAPSECRSVTYLLWLRLLLLLGGVLGLVLGVLLLELLLGLLLLWLVLLGALLPVAGLLLSLLGVPLLS